jgi:hypothetical protein
VEAVGREPAEKATIGVAATTVMLTVYPTVYDGLSPWYGTESKAQKPRRNGHSLDVWMGGNGFRGRVSSVRILPGPLPDGRLSFSHFSTRGLSRDQNARSLA